jgi:hypothetical protein
VERAIIYHPPPQSGTALNVGVGIENEEVEGDIVRVPKVVVVTSLGPAKVRSEPASRQFNFPLLKTGQVAHQEADFVQAEPQLREGFIGRAVVVGADQRGNAGRARQERAYVSDELANRSPSTCS